MTHVRWLTISRALLALVSVLGFAGGLLGLGNLSQATTALDSEQSASPTTTHVRLSAGELPKAWATATPVPSSTPRPVPSPTVIASARAQLADVALSLTPYRTLASSPTPTSSPTSTSSPTPTRTPIHRPADQDPTRITAPEVHLDAKVITVGIKEQYENGVLRKVWEVADYAAGFHEGTARPGHVGNTVISGHNNIRGEVFRDIHKLKLGDDVYLWVGDCPYRYQVGVVYRLPVKGAPPEVEEDNLRHILPTDDQRLTLVTCWPYWANTHRIVVLAFPAPYDF